MTIAWNLDVNVSDLQFRSWSHVGQSKSFADITKDGDVDEKPEYSPGPFTIKRPSTLVLEEVNTQYVGKYKFTVVVAGLPYSSDVSVDVEGKCLLYTHFTLLFSFTTRFHAIFHGTYF